MLEYAFRPRAEPITVEQIPQTGATRASIGNTNKKKNPMLMKLWLGCTMCSRYTKVNKMSKLSDMAKNRNQKLSPSLGGLPFILNRRIHKLYAMDLTRFMLCLQRFGF